jgi:hypothetical protein
VGFWDRGSCGEVGHCGARVGAHFSHFTVGCSHPTRPPASRHSCSRCCRATCLARSLLHLATSGNTRRHTSCGSSDGGRLAGLGRLLKLCSIVLKPLCTCIAPHSTAPCVVHVCLPHSTAIFTVRRVGRIDDPYVMLCYVMLCYVMLCYVTRIDDLHAAAGVRARCVSRGCAPCTHRAT